MNLRARESAILELVEATPLADTHEHLLEESSRLQPGDRWRLNDIGLLFTHYLDSDLIVAGMPRADLEEVFRLETPPERKWALVRPWWPLVRHTGYGIGVRETLRALWGETDLTDGNWRAVSGAIRDGIRPGYYEPILRGVARLCDVQVNSLEADPFCETAQPALLRQDMSILNLALAENRDHLAGLAGVEVRSLADWHGVIDHFFTRHAGQAVAVKNPAAYRRGLDYERVGAGEAAGSFDRILRGDATLEPSGWKAVQDHLFHYCVERATEHGLPVKLHTGYYAGENWMPLARLEGNPGEMCALCQAQPSARFVFMHIAYPYHDAAIAVAKHYGNAWLDMCWAWIVNPAAAVRFLKECLMAAPANKVLCFGGDFGPVELVPGHAAVARRGIARALAELVDEGWLASGDVPALVERLCHANARDLFGAPECPG